MNNILLEQNCEIQSKNHDFVFSFQMNNSYCLLERNNIVNFNAKIFFL